MSGAGTALAAAAAEALRAVEGLAVFAAPPLQASVPYAVVQAAAETDWGHKSGAGREVRLNVVLADRGERAERLADLAEAAEAAVAGLGAVAGWQLVSLRLLRSRIVPPKRGAADALWTGTAEWRARMLA